MGWLVTGGAGYIGSHIVKELKAAGLDPVVLDDFSSGHRDFVPRDVHVVEGSLLDGDLVESALVDHAITGVVHVAGYKYAGESVHRPLHTFQQNVTGTVVLLERMQSVGVRRLVFSSSAAVYGSPGIDVVTEDTPTAPASPYGQSKLIGEWLLQDQETAAGLSHTSLRYFNVVGSGSPALYDSSPHNLFPLVFDALLDGRVPRINGDDYPTPDGTCVRDYVHVTDLALAHVKAARALSEDRELRRSYNLGSGFGVSVRQIMSAVAGVTGVDFEPEVGPRRPGDPARIVASGDRAARDLDWRMRHSLDEMVASAWQARRELRAE